MAPGGETAQQIAIEVWREAEQEFVRRALAHAEQGKFEHMTVALWAERRLRDRWYAAMRGGPEPYWANEGR